MVPRLSTGPVLSHISYEDTKDTDIEKRNEREILKINKRAVGGHYEEKAAEYLKKQGLSIVEKNFRCKTGEIDLIARDGRYLVFVEVKYRGSRESGWASAAVNLKKQERISRAAAFYLVRFGCGEPPCRFDVVAIDGENIEWIRNAFDYRG